MQDIQPDIAYSISLLSRFLSKPTKEHYYLFKGILRYLKGSIKQRIIYSRGNRQGLVAFTNSDYTGKTLTENGKSTSKYVIFLAGEPIYWSSKRQSYVTTSSTESEYVGQANTIKHIVALYQFFTELRLPLTLPITLHADNQSAISLSQNPKFHARTRHIDTAYHYQREKMENGVVKIVYIPTKDMVADGLTKPLTGAKFQQFVKLLQLNK